MYFAWLHAQTGSWTAWLDAEKTGWDRRLAPPWTGLASGWSSAFTEGTVSLPNAANFMAVIIGLAVTGTLLVLKRWPEAVYMALNLTVLICSTTLTSASRYSLTWFPLYILLGQLLAVPERHRLKTLAAVCVTPLTVYGTTAWTVLTFIG